MGRPKGSTLTKEHISKISKSRMGQFLGDRSPSWKGGVSKDKEHLRDLKNDWNIKNWGKVIFSNQRRRALKRYAEGGHTLGEWETLKAQYDWRCPSCHKQEPEISLTEDHIVPLFIGGSDNIENIQPLCRSCNCKKHLKVIKFDK